MKMLLNTKDQKKLLKNLNQKILNYKEILLEKKIIKDRSIRIDIETSIFKRGNFIEKFTEVHLVKYFNLKILKKIIEKNNFELIKFEDFNQEDLSPQKKILECILCSKVFRLQ